MTNALTTNVFRDGNGITFEITHYPSYRGIAVSLTTERSIDELIWELESAEAALRYYKEKIYE